MDRFPLYVYHHRTPVKMRVASGSGLANGELAAYKAAALEASPSCAGVLATEQQPFSLPTSGDLKVLVAMWSTEVEQVVVSRVPLAHLHNKRLNTVCKVWANLEEL